MRNSRFGAVGLAEQQSQTDYEPSDAPSWLPAALGAMLALAVVGVLLILATAYPRVLTPTMRGPVRPLPPTPRLETAPHADLARYKAEKGAELEGYGVTRDGHVRVPIEQAMRAEAARGWSQRQ